MKADIIGYFEMVRQITVYYKGNNKHCIPKWKMYTCDCDLDETVIVMDYFRFILINPCP